MLLGSYSYIFKGPLSLRGGGISGALNPVATCSSAAYRAYGALRNMSMEGDACNESLGFPSGANTRGYVWPRKSQEMVSRVTGVTLGTTGTALMGYPIDGTLTITVDVPNASGQAVASGTGTADVVITVNNLTLTSSINGIGNATFLIEGGITTLGAEASINGTGSFTIDGTLNLDAWGLMEGSTVDQSTITNASIAAAVWDELLALHQDAGSAGEALAAAGSGGVNYSALAQAVWEYATRTLTSGGGGISVDDIMTDPRALTVAKFLGLK